MKESFSKTHLMSTSLKVVNIAYVFCASLSRCAMRCLIRFILTRVSARSPVTACSAGMLFGVPKGVTWISDIGLELAGPDGGGGTRGSSFGIAPKDALGNTNRYIYTFKRFFRRRRRFGARRRRFRRRRCRFFFRLFFFRR